MGRKKRWNKTTMNIESTILQAFPGAHYYPETHLFTWHPEGVLDAALADQVIDFVEAEEREIPEPFNRYVDLDGLTDIQMKFGHTFQIAERRRTTYIGAPVRTAMYSSWVIGFGVARLYQELMRGGPIDVQAFKTREDAAAWLDVPLDLLLPSDGNGDVHIL